jgi:sugar (pentulose or hexulose) kinase
VYPDIQAAAANMVHTQHTIEPDPAAHTEYEFYLDKYIRTYPQMKELMHETVRHVAAGASP